MRAVIDWSFALLSSQARLLFERLAVLPSCGFTLETAEAVCADDRLRSEDIFEMLSSLIAQSMINADFEHGDARYQLLEPMRQYALEKLDERGERDELVKRSARAFVEVAANGSIENGTHPPAILVSGSRCRAGQLPGRTWMVAGRRQRRSNRRRARRGPRARGYSLSAVEGRRWVRLAMGSIEESIAPATLAPLYIADAELCGALGEYKASLSSARHALESQSLLDDVQIARAKQAAGSALGAIGRSAEAETRLEEALLIARRVDNRRLQAMILNELGTARSRRGDVDGARSFYAEALAGYVALELDVSPLPLPGPPRGRVCRRQCGGRPPLSRGGARRSRSHAESPVPWRTTYRTWRPIRRVGLLRRRQSTHAIEGAARRARRRPEAHRSYRLRFPANPRGRGRPGRSQRETQDQRDSRRSAMLAIGFVDARLKTLEGRREYTEQQEGTSALTAFLREAFGASGSRTLLPGPVGSKTAPWPLPATSNSARLRRRSAAEPPKLISPIPRAWRTSGRNAGPIACAPRSRAPRSYGEEKSVPDVSGDYSSVPLFRRAPCYRTCVSDHRRSSCSGC